MDKLTYSDVKFEYYYDDIKSQHNWFAIPKIKGVPAIIAYVCIDKEELDEPYLSHFIESSKLFLKYQLSKIKEME
jgi:hypothetical protein